MPAKHTTSARGKVQRFFRRSALGAHGNLKPFAVLPEAGTFGCAAQSELLESVAVHTVFVLRVGREEPLHRGTRVRREWPAEKIVDAFDGAERSQGPT
jgi:hypothetical protein